MKLVLTNKALEHLSNCLSLPGWCKHENASVSIKRTYLGGKILAEVLPSVPDSPLPPETRDPASARTFMKLLDEWGKKKDTKEFDLDDKMIEVCQVALKYFASQGNTPTGAAMNELIEAFKLNE